jgi:predicted amidohydrolase
MAMIAADRNNAETNPTTGVTVTYGGSASIWQADGERIAHASATDYTKTMTNKPSIIYGMIDPARFDNEQKQTLERRRPELYKELAFYRAPTDSAASKKSSEVIASAVQYRLDTNDFEGNLNRCAALIQNMQNGSITFNLVVLPAVSFSGPVSKDNVERIAEKALGKSTQAASDFAVRLKTHLVASFIEKDGDEVGDNLFAHSTQGEGSERNTKLRRAQISIELLKQGFCKFCAATTGLCFNVKLTGPNFNKCKFSTDKETINKNEDKGDKQVECHNSDQI